MTLEEVMRMERTRVERAEVVISKIKCAEYALHPNTKYLLCFESALTTAQVQALQEMFGGGKRHVYVMSGGEEPKVYSLGDESPIEFPTQRLFLDGSEEESDGTGSISGRISTVDESADSSRP